MKRRIVFRADASGIIGYGHFVRTLALADMLKDDFHCVFYSNRPSEFQIREAAGVCELRPLDYDDPLSPVFIEELDGNDIVVLDNYFFTTEFEEGIKAKGCRLVSIDDIHQRHFCSDIVISHCLGNPHLYDAQASTKLCLGPEWALLRRAFLDCTTPVERGGRWVICFGGADPLNLTARYSEVISRLFPNAEITLVCGSKKPELPEGISAVQNLSAKEMAELFRTSAYVVCSASTTCYEALSCGCEVYAGYYVDNQKGFYENLVAEKLIHGLGNLEADNQHFDISPVASKLDFSGIVQRYRLLFKSLTLNVINYCDLTPEQSRKVWEVRNDERIRRWMNNPEPFPFEHHCRFVESLKNRKDKLYYAFFEGDNFLGSFDLVDIRDGNSAEEGLFVNPDCQGQGTATMMCNLIECGIIRRGVHTLLSDVLENNVKSLSYHLKSGYKEFERKDGHVYLKKELIWGKRF